MQIPRCSFFAGILFLIAISTIQCRKLEHTSSTFQIYIDEASSGRTFEGVGAISSGASSRLLIDYPEPYRSDILDFLFKPDFGANLLQLKVETPGDVNATDGSELAYAHTREEFLHPKASYFNRGYEWWLIKEAKKRNPDIKIETLQWGAPGWVGDGTFYSKENAEFIAGYIKGLEKYHHISIDYTGIRNEVMYDIDWIKKLRKTLDRERLSHVKIDVGDQWRPGDQWKIVRDIAKDSSLNRVVYSINAHVPELTHFYTPSQVQQIYKPVWSGESHAKGGDWYGAAKAARINNRAYPTAKITKVIYWSLISSYPDYLTAPKSGIMKANTPWSANYTVQPPLWIDAHINQFAKPGWKYIDSGCKFFQREGWSVITLENPDTHDYSIIIETMDAKEKQAVHFGLENGFSDKPLAVWQSAFKQFLFQRQEDITPDHREFTIALQPNAIYSLTTTRGQHKGAPGHTILSPAPFPNPYKDNFDRDTLNREPPFFINYHGAFEVVKDPQSGNQYLKQFSRQQGMNWFHQPYPRILLGDSRWTDTQVSVDFLLPDSGTVRLESRLHQFGWNSKIKGYGFEINDRGKWGLKLTNDQKILQGGQLHPMEDEWHHLQMKTLGDQISVSIDQKQVVSITDTTFKAGIVSLSTGWNVALFDNFAVEADPPIRTKP